MRTPASPAFRARRRRYFSRGRRGANRRGSIAPLLVPPDRPLVEVDVDVLDLQVLVEAVRTELAPEPGLLVAAPRGLHGGRLHVVDPDYAGAQALDRPDRLEDVARPHGGGQAVGRVVGDADGVLLLVEGDDRHDRTEDLLAGDGRGIVHVVEDRRLDEEAALRLLRQPLRTAAAQRQLGFLPADLDVRQHLVVLVLADQGAHLRVGGETGTDRDFL